MSAEAVRLAGPWVARRRHLGLLIVLLMTLPALWPLLRPGFFSSDDGLFHVYRIAALADAWSQGVLHPRLFSEFGFGYGQAVLNFYAPLSYWPGAALALLGFSPATGMELSVALALLLAALAAYGFVRSLWGEAAGVLAAVAYTYFPYHLADAYQRGALPELCAFVWLPLILWAHRRTVTSDRPLPPMLWGALAWTGLVLTHNLTAMLMAPVAVANTLWVVVAMGRWRRLAPVAGSLALALAMSAAYWLPVAMESRFVGLALGPSAGYEKHLAPLRLLMQSSPLYAYRVDLDGLVYHPLSWLSVVVLLAGAGLIAWRLLRRRENIPHLATAIFGLTLALGSAFLITAPAVPVWRVLAPILAHLQYPWRFLSLTALGVSIVAGVIPALMCQYGGRASPAGSGSRAEGLQTGWDAAKGEPPADSAGAEVDFQPAQRSASLHQLGRSLMGLPGRRWKGWHALAGVGALSLALMLTSLPGLPAERLDLPAQEAWAPDRMWREDAQNGQVGATWTGEFLPLTVSEQRWALGRPLEGAPDGIAMSPQPAIKLLRVGYNRFDLQLTTGQPLTARLHQFYLPGWRAWLGDTEAPTYASGELGLVTVDVPAGEHEVRLAFAGTGARLAGGAVSLLAVVAWLLIARRSGRKGLLPAAGILGMLALLLALNALGLGQRTWQPEVNGSRVGDVALLLGHDAATPRGAIGLDVTLYWFALRDVGTNYKAFVHLVGPDGQVVAQHDGDPAGGFTPTSRWRSGELILDRHALALPHGVQPGRYRLYGGLYRADTLQNLPVDPPAPDDRVFLGEVQVD